MRLKYTEGCTLFSTTINNEEIVNMKIEDIKIILKKLIDREPDLASLQHIFIDLLSSQGDYEYVSHCGECDDDIYTYTLNIDE